MTQHRRRMDGRPPTATDRHDFDGDGVADYREDETAGYVRCESDASTLTPTTTARVGDFIGAVRLTPTGDPEWHKLHLFSVRGMPGAVVCLVTSFPRVWRELLRACAGVAFFQFRRTR